MQMKNDQTFLFYISSVFPQMVWVKFRGIFAKCLTYFIIIIIIIIIFIILSSTI